ncbi:MAG: DNA-3-methyladenine glycosylase 2 family protein, partial [Acidobacteriaceae bacterium]|nr:DNA-3-methyladenine glycosylase 2 family protein [Acidobacteriaceae bacterium]
MNPDCQTAIQRHLRLPFRPPYAWDTMLAFLSPRATPGIEVVTLGSYCRSISLNGSTGYFEVSLDEPNNALAVRLQFGDPRSLSSILERIRAMFDLDSDWAVIAQSLGKDPALQPPLNAVPGLRVPGSWNGFELAIRAILGQQVSVKAATTLAGRMVKTYGEPVNLAPGLTHLFPSAGVLADATLSSIGLPKARAETIRALARAVCNGQIRFDGITETDAFLARLTEIPGIGKWTAQYIAMRALGERDAFPSGDLGLLRALRLQSSRELESRAEAWRPWRAYA